MQGCRRKSRKHAALREKSTRDKIKVKETIRRRERLALRSKAKPEKTRSEKYGALRGGILTNTYLHGPMDFAKTLN